VHPEYSSLKRIVPAAAAIAVATVNAANPALAVKADIQIHRDATSLSEAPGQDPRP
jgi:stearoyl-CoA desaturase (delta-9 desaturase)